MVTAKKWGIRILTILTLALATFFVAPTTFAEDESMVGDVLHSVTMTYDQDVVDIYNNPYVISIDDQKDVTLDFDVDHSVKTILLRDITEDGEAKNICQTGTKQCSFNATKLIAKSGLEIVLYDWDDAVVRQTMLGLIIKQNATKEDFEKPVTLGPLKDIKIDMGTLTWSLRSWYRRQFYRCGVLGRRRKRQLQGSHFQIQHVSKMERHPKTSGR